LTIFVEVHKNVLDSQIARLGGPRVDEKPSDYYYRQGLVAAMKWILNGGPTPSQLMGDKDE
jgi:hypothetical protein